MNREQISLLVLSIFYILVSLISLYFCFINHHKIRKIFKAIPTLILIILLIILLYKHPLIYLALIFGLLGDLFLLSFNKKMFLIGGICFLIEHILNLHIVFLINNTSFPLYLLMIYFPLIILIFIGGILIFKKSIKPYFLIFGSIYVSTLLLNFISGIILTSITHNYLLLLYVFGYLIFMISDSFVAYKRFIKPFNKVQFLIMSTYYVAQYLLYLYFILILAIK